MSGQTTTLEAITRVGQPPIRQGSQIAKDLRRQFFEVRWPQTLEFTASYREGESSASYIGGGEFSASYIEGGEFSGSYTQGYPDFYNLWGVSNFAYLQQKLNASNDRIQGAVAMDVRVMHGNPVFRGTRIPVYQIVEELADGTTLSEILEGYPSLSLGQVQGGLDFAASLLRLYND